MFPFQQVLREGTSVRFCCIPPSGVSITNITLSNKNYPLIDVGARVKAIAVDNLTIPTNEIQAILLGCKDEIRQMSWWTWNYVSCKFESQHLFAFVFDFKDCLCMRMCCSSSPEAQKPQLCDLRPDNCYLRLGFRQKTISTPSQQSNSDTPHRVRTWIIRHIYSLINTFPGPF